MAHCMLKFILGLSDTARVDKLFQIFALERTRIRLILSKHMKHPDMDVWADTCIYVSVDTCVQMYLCYHVKLLCTHVCGLALWSCFLQVPAVFISKNAVLSAFSVSFDMIDMHAVHPCFLWAFANGKSTDRLWKLCVTCTCMHAYIHFQTCSL